MALPVAENDAIGWKIVVRLGPVEGGASGLRLGAFADSVSKSTAQLKRPTSSPSHVTVHSWTAPSTKAS